MIRRARRPSNIKQSDANASKPMFRPNTLGPPPNTESRPPGPTTDATTPIAAIASVAMNSPPQNPAIVACTPVILSAPTIRTHAQTTNSRSYAFAAAAAGSGAQTPVAIMYQRNSATMPPNFPTPCVSNRLVPLTAATAINHTVRNPNTHSRSSRNHPVPPAPMKRSTSDRPMS